MCAGLVAMWGRCVGHAFRGARPCGAPLRCPGTAAAACGATLMPACGAAAACRPPLLLLCRCATPAQQEVVGWQGRGGARVCAWQPGQARLRHMLQQCCLWAETRTLTPDDQ